MEFYLRIKYVEMRGKEITCVSFKSAISDPDVMVHSIYYWVGQEASKQF